MNYKKLTPAYHDIKTNTYYTVFEHNGKLSLYYLTGEKDWIVLRAGGVGGGKFVCSPIASPIEAENILKLYILEKGLSAFKYNFSYDFFPQPEKIKMNPIKIKYHRR